MDNINSIVEKFIEPYKQDNNILAAFLTGSYAVGNQNDYSDIDIFLVSSDELKWRERGNRIISEHLVEYFINPSKKLFEEMNNEIKTNDRVTSTIIANGKILFDKINIIEKLHKRAIEVIKSPLILLDNNEIERIKYFTHYYFDQLTRAYKTDKNEFWYLYYTFLEHLIYSYGKYKGIILSPRTKIYKYIEDGKYKINESFKKLNDKKYLKLLIDCMKKNEAKIMYKNIYELKEYQQKIMGGFNIDGWKIKSEIN